MGNTNLRNKQLCALLSACRGRKKSPRVAGMVGSAFLLCMAVRGGVARISWEFSPVRVIRCGLG